MENEANTVEKQSCVAPQPNSDLLWFFSEAIYENTLVSREDHNSASEGKITLEQSREGKEEGRKESSLALAEVMEERCCRIVALEFEPDSVQGCGHTESLCSVLR